MTKLFDIIFAASGDLSVIPDATQSDGSLSYTQGYPVGYSTIVTSGGRNIERAKFNQLMNDVTGALSYLQYHGAPEFFPYISSNGGYSIYDRVRYGGAVYKSLINSNTDLPTVASSWVLDTLGGINVFTGGVTTGSANAQALATTSPPSSTFTTGQSIICTAGYTNTASASFAGGTEAPLTIKKDSSGGLTNLTGGEIVAGDTIILTRSVPGACWILTAGLPLGALAYLNAGGGLSLDGSGNLQISTDGSQFMISGGYLGYGPAPTLPLSRNVFYVRDQETSGTAPPASVNSYTTRTLNTVVFNNITGASLSTNQVTVPTGTYEFFGRAPGYNCQGHKTRLQNLTDSVTIAYGSSAYSGSSVTSDSFVRGIVTLAGTKTLALQHNFFNTSGLQGQATSLGDIEVYAELRVRKIL